MEQLRQPESPPKFAITLTDGPVDQLGLFTHDDGVLATVPRRGLNEALVRAWAQRFGVAVLEDTPACARTPAAIASPATLVLAPDPAVAGLAASYAEAVGATFSSVADADSMAALVAGEQHAASATVVLLGESLDQQLIDALARGNAERCRSGRRALTSGVIAAFDPPKLAWLLAKTLICLDLAIPENAVIGRFDGARGTISARELAGGGQSSEPREPWMDPQTLAQSVVAHGAAFDLALGEVVLCSHLDPPLTPAQTTIAPSCFQDGVCFRLGRDDGPSLRRHAHEATPLFWGIDSCGTIPFRDNAFGRGSSYALALLSGSAVAVIGSYLALTTSGLAARVFEALLGAGWSTGQIAAALGCVDHNAAEFNPYVCLGSPDLCLPSPASVPLEDEQGTVPVRAEGTDIIALELTPERTELRDVIEDDGADAWRAALGRRVDAPGRSALVVAFDGPRQLDGKLRLADAQAARDALEQRCTELDRHLGILAGYEFAAPHAASISTLRASVEEALACVRATYAVRSIPAALQRLVVIGEELSTLEAAVAKSFVRTVLERDVSFDRESENGFIAGPLQRTDEPCHICRGPLYVALDRWAEDERHRRLKATCPNCFGVAMRPAISHLDSVEIDAQASPDGVFRVWVTAHSAVERPLRVLVAAAPRRGHTDDRARTATATVPARDQARVAFEFAPSDSGVVTYRILVLCEAAVELYTAIDPSTRRIASASIRQLTVVGLEPAEHGQGSPDGLSHTG